MGISDSCGLKECFTYIMCCIPFQPLLVTGNDFCYVVQNFEFQVIAFLFLVLHMWETVVMWFDSLSPPISCVL